MSLSTRQKILRNRLEEFALLYSEPKSLEQRLILIYAEFDSLNRQVLNSPGGHREFSKENSGYSMGSLSAMRTNIEEDIFNIQDNPVREKRYSLDNSAYVQKIQEFNQVAKAYLEKVVGKFYSNTSWVVYFHDSPLDDEFGIPKIGTAVLKIASNFECEIHKKDFPFEPDEVIYRGTYKNHSNRYGDNILSFNMVSSDDRKLDILTLYDLGTKSYHHKEPLRIGIFNQFDGLRIQAGRILLELIDPGLDVNEAKRKKEKLTNNTRKLSSIIEVLGSKDQNYISSYNRMDGSDLALQKASFNNSAKFVDHEPIRVLVSSDLPILDMDGLIDLAFEEGEKLKDPGNINNTIGTLAGMFSYFLHYEKDKPIRLFLRNEKMPHPPTGGYKFFVHVDFGIGQSSLAYTYLGLALLECKNVLFIYNLDKPPTEQLEFLENQSVIENYAVKVRLMAYKDFTKESSLIYLAIREFIALST